MARTSVRETVRLFAAMAALAVGGCSVLQEPDPPITKTELDRMKSEARALANPSGCESSGQCASAPMGAKPCGGPWEYVVYCPLTTDTGALFRALEAVEKAEREYNETSGVVSDCMFVTPPDIEIVGGNCRAVAP